MGAARKGEREDRPAGLPVLSVPQAPALVRGIVVRSHAAVPIAAVQPLLGHHGLADAVAERGAEDDVRGEMLAEGDPGDADQARGPVGDPRDPLLLAVLLR